MATRKYAAGVRAALISFSAGLCYWPGCGEQLLSNVNGKYYINLDIAHICALESGGPRYDPQMTDQQRNDFPNLIFLCRPHHRAVDDNSGKNYSVETLRLWKCQNETSEQASLRASTWVTTEVLEHAITQAIAEQNRRIEDTLNRLEENDQEAAAVMQELLREVKEHRRSDSSTDPDIAAMLSNAAWKLAGLEDSAAVLNQAADKLRGLEETTEALNSAAHKMSKVQEFM